MENLNFLLLDTDFIEACENFLHNYNQASQLLVLIKSLENHDKTLLYAEAVQAHTEAIKTYTRMTRLALECVENAKPHLDALLHKG